MKVHKDAAALRTSAFKTAHIALICAISTIDCHILCHWHTAGWGNCCADGTNRITIVSCWNGCNTRRCSCSVSELKRNVSTKGAHASVCVGTAAATHGAEVAVSTSFPFTWSKLRSAKKELCCMSTRAAGLLRRSAAHLRGLLGFAGCRTCPLLEQCSRHLQTQAHL